MPVIFIDKRVKKIKEQCMTRPEFSGFESIHKSDKFIICRSSNVPPSTISQEERDKWLDYEKDFFDRRRYGAGDIRVSFYKVTCPNPVKFLAKQVQVGPDSFVLRPWNYFD